MSAMRVHKLRALAVQKLAAAYRTDEIASSVMVMQGGSVFDDIAERVLRFGASLMYLCDLRRLLSGCMQILTMSMHDMCTSFMKRYPLGMSRSEPHPHFH